jgi:hypothetical protein
MQPQAAMLLRRRDRNARAEAARMIRGPVLPQTRDNLWGIVAARLDQIESGLTLAYESFDCSGGQLGPVEGLARDALGGVVLVLLAIDGDAVLPARMLAASDFLRRAGDALVLAVPEAKFTPGAAQRVLVVGTEAASSALAQVRRLPVAGLQVACLEPFRLAGAERFAVRWLPVGAAADAVSVVAAAGTAADQAFVPPPAAESLWRQLRDTCTRIDDGVQLVGDRHARRILWNGRELGDVRVAGGRLVGHALGLGPLDLVDGRSLRVFGDRLLRAYVCEAGLPIGDSARSGGESAEARAAAPRHAAAGRLAPPRGGESLRSSLAAARLSPEEYSALGDSAVSAGSDAEPFVAENDKARSAPGSTGNSG